MSLVFNMVGGAGGSGFKDTDAILTVSVPTGSTVTATKGGIALTPTIWVQAADNTLDFAIFDIKPSLFDAVNPWTVTGTLGTETASDTVIIDSNKEYNVKIDYNFYFIRNGVILESYTLVGTTGTFTDEDGAIKYTVNGYYKESLCYFRTNANKYNSFVMNLRSGRVYRGTEGERTPYIAILTSPPTTTQPSPTTYTRLTSSAAGLIDMSENTFTLDISNVVRGDASLYFNIHCGNDTPAWFIIENLYLAK